MKGKSIQTYKARIVKALKESGRYSAGLVVTIDALANTMRTLDLCSSEIDGLDCVTVTESTRYGSKLAPHPVFRVQRDAQESLSRLCKALGLTSADLLKDGSDDGFDDFMKRMEED